MLPGQRVAGRVIQPEVQPSVEGEHDHRRHEALIHRERTAPPHRPCQAVVKALELSVDAVLPKVRG